MGYVKKSFDGEYLKMHDTISSHGNVSVLELGSYTHVLSSIKALQWEGNSKESICTKIDQIDSKCDNFYTEVSCMIKKTKITYGVLFQELKLLKQKIEEYNNSVDDYNRIYSQLQTAKQQEGGTNE